MLLWLVGATWMRGESLTAMLASLGLDANGLPIQGVLAHVALSALCGVLWGLLACYAVRPTRIPFWLAGLGYGVLVSLVSMTLLLHNSIWHTLPSWLLICGHLIYGLGLGLAQGPLARSRLT